MVILLAGVGVGGRAVSHVPSGSLGREQGLMGTGDSGVGRAQRSSDVGSRGFLCVWSLCSGH